MCIGIARDWQHPTLKDMHFNEYVERFDAAPPGSVVIFPENPEGWEMRLVKHSAAR
jgi:hypothetical protein